MGRRGVIGGTQAVPLAVGVFDEPELVVAGLDQMLARGGGRARLRPLADGRGDAHLDVLLCDPVDRDVDIEQYLAHVASLTAAPVLVYSWSRRTSSVRRALAAGARGFLSKEGTSAELVAGVEAVHRGEIALPALRVQPQAGEPRLSAREREVLELICRGLSNKEIGSELFVSVNSVKTHVRQVYQKIGVQRRAQAVVWGLSRGY